MISTVGKDGRSNVDPIWFTHEKDDSYITTSQDSVEATCYEM